MVNPLTRKPDADGRLDYYCLITLLKLLLQFIDCFFITQVDILLK